MGGWGVVPPLKLASPCHPVEQTTLAANENVQPCEHNTAYELLLIANKWLYKRDKTVGSEDILAFPCHIDVPTFLYYSIYSMNVVRFFYIFFL